VEGVSSLELDPTVVRGVVPRRPRRGGVRWVPERVGLRHARVRGDAPAELRVAVHVAQRDPGPVRVDGQLGLPGRGLRRGHGGVGGGAHGGAHGGRAGGALRHTQPALVREALRQIYIVRLGTFTVSKVKTNHPFRGMPYLFGVWNQNGMLRILVIFQCSLMFSHIIQKVSARTFHWCGWT